MTLTAWMKRNGKKAADLSRGTGIPDATISRFLSGRTMLSPSHMLLVQKYTERESDDAVSLEDLIREGERLRKKRGQDAEVAP